MGKRRFINTAGHFIYFTDLQNEDKILCMTQEVYNELKPLTFKPERAPDDSYIKAFPLEKTGENQVYDFYNIVINEPINFHVNRIKWIYTYADPNVKV
ncbi:MAG: hypothetical protein ABR927_14605 [Bacteroidales bacterium]|jgi:hypothetical protein